MMSTQKGGGRGVINICHMFAYSIILSNRAIAHFFGWWKWEDHLLHIFCGCRKWVTSKTIISKKKKKKVWNQNASDIPKILI